MGVGWLDDGHVELASEPFQFGSDGNPGSATPDDQDGMPDFAGRCAGVACWKSLMASSWELNGSANGAAVAAHINCKQLKVRVQILAQVEMGTITVTPNSQAF